MVWAAAIGTITMGIGQLTLAYAPTVWLSLLGGCAVYFGQAIEDTNAVTIMSMVATDSNRGQIMSMQQASVATGRVIGPILLGPPLRYQLPLPVRGCRRLHVAHTTLVLLGIGRATQQTGRSQVAFTKLEELGTGRSDEDTNSSTP